MFTALVYVLNQSMIVRRKFNYYYEMLIATCFWCEIDPSLHYKSQVLILH